MSALPHASLLCPHCYREFRVAAWRVLPGAELSCPHCETAVCLDGRRPEHRQSIADAEAAQQRQRDKVEQLKTLLRPHLSPEPAPNHVDDLMDRLRGAFDELSQQSRKG